MSDLKKKLPENPQKRRSILVVSSQDWDDMGSKPEHVKATVDLKRNEYVFVLSVPCALDDSITVDLERRGLLNPGTLLVQNPFDPDHYEEVTNANAAFGLDKVLKFRHFCQMLGAKEFLIEKVEMLTTDGKLLASCGVRVPGITTVGASVEHRELEKISSKLKLHDTYRPTADSQSSLKPDISKAEQYAIQRRLLGDRHVLDLLESAKCDFSQIDKREVILTLSSESRSNLKVALNVSVPFYADIKSQLERIRSEQYEFNLHINLRF